MTAIAIRRFVIHPPGFGFIKGFLAEGSSSASHKSDMTVPFRLNCSSLARMYPRGGVAPNTESRCYRRRENEPFHSGKPDPRHLVRYPTAGFRTNGAPTPLSIFLQQSGRYLQHAQSDREPRAAVALTRLTQRHHRLQCLSPFVTAAPQDFTGAGSGSSVTVPSSCRIATPHR
jgi:hypothetical protein